jgi:hypothetical protein
MKRLIVGVAVLGAAAVLGGCPIYPSNSDYRVCDGTSCYDCPDQSKSTSCVPWQCSADSDCGDGYVCLGSGTCGTANPYDGGPVNGQACSNPGQCASGATCGIDGKCDTGDCSMTGCVAPYVCKLSGGVFSCATIGPPPGDDASTDDGGSDAGNDSATDSGDGAVQPIACNADTDCSANSFCIDGYCTTQGNLCSDGTQCVVAGDLCVEGRCTTTCNQNNPCATGYSCNFDLVAPGVGVCNLNPAPCINNGGCQGGTVCVESHCAAPCVASDAGLSCPAAGQLCVNGGCIPDEKALFTCTNDGSEGPPANACAAGSICLHHDCYVDCAGASEGGVACASNQTCKQVKIVKGTYSVCGGATNLGSDCDPQSGLACASAKTCVDDYCR